MAAFRLPAFNEQEIYFTRHGPLDSIQAIDQKDKCVKNYFDEPGGL